MDVLAKVDADTARCGQATELSTAAATNVDDGAAPCGTDQISDSLIGLRLMHDLSSIGWVVVMIFRRDSGDVSGGKMPIQLKPRNCDAIE